MKSGSNISYTASSLFEDYATAPVPESARISGLPQGLVLAGIAFCVTLFSVGAMLAAAMGFVSFLTAVLFGSAILTFIGLLIGSIGARTHLSSAFNARFTLGKTGGKLFGVILAVSLFGWFGYQCYYFALSTVSALHMFGFSGGSTAVWSVAGGLLMTLTVIAGFNGITMLSAVGVPLLFAIALYSAAVTAGQTDIYTIVSSAAPAEGGMSVSGGTVIVVGSLITGSCVISDISRFSRNRSNATACSVLGFMIGFPLTLLLGGFFYYAYGVSEPCEVLLVYCDMGIFVPFLLLVSTWTTNGYNLYCSVLGISSAIDGGHVRLPHWLLVLAGGIISTLLGALGIMDTFASFLNLLGVLIPPVAAVIIADFYFYNRHSSLYAFESAETLPNFRVNTCLSAVVGIAAGLLCNYSGLGFFNALCSVVPACIVAMLSSGAALVICNMLTHSGNVSSPLS